MKFTADGRPVIGQPLPDQESVDDCIKVIAVHLRDSSSVLDISKHML